MSDYGELPVLQVEPVALRFNNINALELTVSIFWPS